MKIAIVCDWLVTLGGAEKVLGELIHCFPEADLFAVMDFLPVDKRDCLQGKPVKTSFIQRLPFASKKHRLYLPLMPLAIEQLDVSGYDVVISSSHAVAKGVITGPDQLHISYVHSPMRYAWDMQHQYLKEAGLDYGVKSVLARGILHKMRVWDQRTANSVDHFIANSNFIARRIWKTYRRTADIIYPPVDTEKFKPGLKKENFYLTASRLVPYKKIDLIVESFARMPEKKLLVVGEGPELNKIKSKATNNIEILGYQATDNLVNLMQQAKAFVFAAEEDFGIAPLEAQACGTPVVAFGRGGVLETVRGLDQANPTGIFFAEQTTSSICDAIKQLEKNLELFTADAFKNQVSLFTPTVFRNKMTRFVSEQVEAIKI